MQVHVHTHKRIRRWVVFFLFFNYSSGFISQLRAILSTFDRHGSKKMNKCALVSPFCVIMQISLIDAGFSLLLEAGNQKTLVISISFEILISNIEIWTFFYTVQPYWSLTTSTSHKLPSVRSRSNTFKSIYLTMITKFLVVIILLYLSYSGLYLPFCKGILTHPVNTGSHCKLCCLV